MNKFLLPLFIFISSLFLSNSVLSQTAEYEFASIENDAPQHIAQILLPQIYQKIGKNITITPLPAKRAEYEANTGIKAGEILRIYSYGTDNENLIRVPTPYYSLSTAAFALKNKNIVISSEKDLMKYKLGKVNGIKHTKNITKGFKDVFDSKNVDTLFQQLLLGNIDIALTSLIEGNLILKQKQFSEVQVLHPGLAKLSMFNYIHHKHQHLVAPVDQTIKELKASGELATMVAHAEQKILY